MESAPNKQESDDYSDQEKRLLHLYGKLPRKTDLLHHQLESRQYFDSGDFALSQASESSDIGAVHTGTEHPSSKSVSHPAAPVPNSSNVARGANGQQCRDGGRTMCGAGESGLINQQSYSEGAARMGEYGGDGGGGGGEKK